MEALSICEKLNLHKPIGGQDQYSMLVRNMHEVEYKTVFSNYKYGLMAWGPLAGGILTGKYLNGIPENEVSRFNDNKFFFPLDVLKTIHYNPFAT